MNTKNLIIAIVAIAAVAGIVIIMRQGYPSTTQTPPASSGQPNAVNIENFSFNPGTLTVKAGTAVVWTNSDSVTHTIKSDSFNSQPLSKGQTFEFKFDNKGTYDYSCGIHPSMKGKIIVE